MTRIIQDLEVFPAEVTLRPGDEQTIVVRAKYSDGRVRDVTAVGEVRGDERGGGHGRRGRPHQSRRPRRRRGHRLVFEQDRQRADHVAVRRRMCRTSVFAEAPRQNFIDELVLKQLQLLNLPPAPPADDATFIRRAFLDTIGKLPTADEVRAFLADQSPDKRDRLIEALLPREEFVDYWAYQWSDLLLVNGTRLRPDAVKAFYSWIRQRVSENTPWDEFARQIVLARGSSFENGATNFYALHQDPETMTENVSQAFLGLSIGCAKCHNHPLEKWTNDQYYAMANLFARVPRQRLGRRCAKRRRRADAVRRQPRRSGSTVDGRAAAAGAARRRAAGGRRIGRSPRVPGRLAHVARESVLRPGDHESRVGQLLRRRAGRADRRPAAVEPGQQRRAAGRRGRSISSTRSTI